MEDHRLIRGNGVDVLGTNILYLVIAIVLLTLGAYVQHRDVKTGLIITEYVIILLPPLLYAKFRGHSFKDIKKIFRLNKLRVKHGILIVLIGILAYPVVAFFNLIVLTCLSMFGELKQMPIPTANNMGEYFVLMLIVSMSAGICEEVYFRGLVLHVYERLGKTNAIVITSVLFGIFHFNIQNLIGPIILGIIFGYLVQRTNSLFAGIIGHMTNNGVAVTLGFLVNLSRINISDEKVAQAATGTKELMGATFFMGCIGLFTGIGAYKLLKIIINDTEEKKCEIAYEEVTESVEDQKKPSIFVYLPILITLVIFIWLSYIQMNI